MRIEENRITQFDECAVTSHQATKSQSLFGSTFPILTFRPLPVRRVTYTSQSGKHSTIAVTALRLCHVTHLPLPVSVSLFFDQSPTNIIGTGYILGFSLETTPPPAVESHSPAGEGGSYALNEELHLETLNQYRDCSQDLPATLPKFSRFPVSRVSPLGLLASLRGYLQSELE